MIFFKTTQNMKIALNKVFELFEPQMALNEAHFLKNFLGDFLRKKISENSRSHGAKQITKEYAWVNAFCMCTKNGIPLIIYNNHTPPMSFLVQMYIIKGLVLGGILCIFLKGCRFWYILKTNSNHLKVVHSSFLSGFLAFSTLSNFKFGYFRQIIYGGIICQKCQMPYRRRSIVGS